MRIHHFSALPNVHGFVTVMDTQKHSIFPLTVLPTDEESFALSPPKSFETVVWVAKRVVKWAAK